MPNKLARSRSSDPRPAGRTAMPLRAGALSHKSSAVKPASATASA
jgi:hypothetical protein